LARTVEIAAPPVVPWAQWYANKEAELTQGMHVLFIGPTQSGKTLLCRKVARIRKFVVVFGTKPVDPSLVAYVDEGYIRIDHWPPTKQDYKKGAEVWPAGEARFIIWPKMVKRDDLRRFRDVYAKCMEEVFIEGRWCIVADEGLWIAGRGGLNLGQQLSDVAYGSASNKVSLYLCVQRQANVQPVTWTSVSEAEIFHMGRADDVRDMASLGVYPPKETIAAVQGLRGHRFLSLPTRGGAEWSISEVDLNGA
jgi:hypothetical protein